MTRRQRIILIIGAMAVLHTAVFAQLQEPSPQPGVGVGSGRIFTVYGDLQMFELDGSAPSNTFFDLILYPRGGNEAVARQRVGKGGRYRFFNIPEGNYLMGVEYNNIEIARVAMLISQKKAEPIRQDIELEWTSSLRNKLGIVQPTSYIRPNQNRALFEKAMKEINKNDLVKATAILRSIVEADPKDFQAWTELGMVYFIQKNFTGAESSYGKAIELEPDSVTALVSLGRVRLAQKNNEGAIKILEDALKVDPKSATANYFLGEAYLALKKGSVAIEHLNTAIKLDPNGMANAHLRLATLYNLAGYKDLAAIEYNEFLKKRPEYPEAQKLREYIIANNPRSKRNPSPSPSPNP